MDRIIKKLSSSALLVFVLSVHGGMTGRLYAGCQVRPNSNKPYLDDQVYGTVLFQQQTGSTKVRIDIAVEGFNTHDTDILHGFHIHEFDDLSKGCDSTGSHFNPEGFPHGGPQDRIRHIGDLGNIEEDSNGQVAVILTDDRISLVGSNSIIGKSVVIHQSEDDLGASGDPAGAAGTRLACCKIKEYELSWLPCCCYWWCYYCYASCGYC